MASKHPDLILGTAGHIDHGKSALVLALTGTDPDRLAEEKARGITIELGFAQLELPDGRTMGVVDVPGHERFVRQMIAGATGIDVALLCIAADDGVMPQTIEHIAVLQTLGVRACVVALTKTDLVDDDWIEFVAEEVRARLADTPYAEAAIVPVSSKTGTGLDELRRAIAQACRGVQPSHAGASMRQPIDRVFTIKGAGTVVTGTLWSGTVRPGDTLAVLPGNRECRVRSVQVHGADVEFASAGNRVAINLAGVSTDEVHPGDFLATPDTVHATDRFDAWVTFLDTAKTGKPLASGSRMHISHGTREVLGRVLFMNGRAALEDGQSSFAQIRLEEDLPVSNGDRFVVRTFSPVSVAGGGVVLAAHPRLRTNLDASEMALLEHLRDGNMQAAVEKALETQKLPVNAQALARMIGIGESSVLACLETASSKKRILSLGTDGTPCFATRQVRQKSLAALDKALLAFHAENPAAAGMAKDALRQRAFSHIDAQVFDALLDEAHKAGIIVRAGAAIGHPTASGAAQAALEARADELASILASSGMTPPTLADAASAMGIPIQQASKAAALLEESGRAWRATSDLFFDAAAIDKGKAAVKTFLDDGGEGTATALKDLLGTSRKYAIPILERFDAERFTIRNGDVRTLG